MTSIGTLYAYDAQAHSKRIRATAAVAGLKLDLAKNYVHYETNRTPEFKAKFRSGKIPAFESSDEFCLFEGCAIARYIASLAPESQLLGNSLKEAALVDQWVSFVDHELGTKAGMLVTILEGKFPYSTAADQGLRSRVIRALDTLNAHLIENKYLVLGTRLTLADIMFAAVVQRALETLFDASLRKQFPAVVRLYEDVVSHPAIGPIFGKTEYVEMALQYSASQEDKTSGV